MAETKMIEIQIDGEAGLAYMRFFGNPVARTEEFTPEVMIDLDEYGMVVGIELLTLYPPLSDAQLKALTEKYHVPADILDILPVATSALGEFTRPPTRRSGSLRPTLSGELQPC